MSQTTHNPDASQRFIFENADIRGEIVRLHKSYLDTVRGKQYPEPVAALLGQFLAASALLSTTIKFDGRLVIQARSEGEVTVMMGECTSAGEVRGIARYAQTPTSEQFSEMLRDGNLVITIDTRKGQPHQGIVALEGTNLAECLEAYFYQSEQLGSMFYFAADKDHVAALMLQQLPAHVHKDVDERSRHWEHFSTLARTLTDAELLSLPNADILNRLYHQEELRLFAPRDLKFACSCTRERTARAVSALGKEEVNQIIAEQGGVEISCEFCGTEYNFGPGELALLFEGAEEGSSH
jgi:molecular chaperone Hsp33